MPPRADRPVGNPRRSPPTSAPPSSPRSAPRPRPWRSGSPLGKSIDLAELIVGEGVLYSVEFTATTADLGTVTQSFVLDGLHGAQSFVFDGRFIDLVSVSWANTPGYHQLDNIEVVPEPATLAIALSGLGLMGVMVRARRTGAA